MHTHLQFVTHIGRQKPESIRNRDTQCPFCQREQLEGILDQTGTIILLKNKYPVLAETFQTVLIETDDCEGELSEYDKTHLYTLFEFGLRHWSWMRSQPAYRSVLFYKNHGPQSGGTIRHPHMQIVGLHRLDYREHVRSSHFEGEFVSDRNGVVVNVSTKPRVGFFEFNVLASHWQTQIETIADAVQSCAHYALNGFHRGCNSYNLFFYEAGEGDGIAVKITPRFVTSPLFVGFSIPQVSDRIVDVARDLRETYF